MRFYSMHAEMTQTGPGFLQFMLIMPAIGYTHCPLVLVVRDLTMKQFVWPLVLGSGLTFALHIAVHAELMFALEAPMLSRAKKAWVKCADIKSSMMLE